jgi:CDP-diacylglycerol--glycerol-3-phosphate 3-phosphatidyltransferase
MNLANKLTLSRFFMVPFFVGFMAIEESAFGLGWQTVGRLLALVLFIAAAVTDYYDGKLARKHGWVSNFGRLMDPLADKLIVMSAFVVFVELRTFPAWMVIIILCREFLITGLRLLGTTQGRVIQADRWGKNKTISQMTVIITTLVLLSFEDILKLCGVWNAIRLGAYDGDFFLQILLHVLMLVAVFFTVVSGLFYFWRNRDLLTESVAQSGS